MKSLSKYKFKIILKIVLLFYSFNLLGADLMNNKVIYIKVNGNFLEVQLENNSSADALIDKLQSEDTSIQMKDYANMEKVGSLGYSLVTNDKPIDTVSGDVILYQGKYFVIYYDTNSWTLTKLGKITNANKQELKKILGEKEVEIVLTLKKD